MDPMSIVLAAGKYVTWGVVSISVTNLVVIVVMIAVFVLALLMPFPRGHESPPDRTTGDARGTRARP
jgi:hypothetical protein